MSKRAFNVTAALGLVLVASTETFAARLRLPPARAPANSIYSPAAIAGDLAKRGYRIEKMKRKGTAYSVTATGPHGNRVQMLVDGQSGGIVGLTVLQAAANLIGAIATAMKSGKSSRYYDDTRPFGVIVPDRYQVNWTQITNFNAPRGASRYVSAPKNGRGYRYAVPYRTIRPAVGGGTRSTYSPSQMSRPLYDVYESNGSRMETVETREDSMTMAYATSEETRYSSQEETFESSYEATYFGSDVDEASIEAAYDYDAEDGDYIFADDPNDNYDPDVVESMAGNEDDDDDSTHTDDETGLDDGGDDDGGDDDGGDDDGGDDDDDGGDEEPGLR